MPDFITLTCPSCGGKLKVTDQVHLLACRNCGNEHMVMRDGGSIYLAPIAQDVRQIRVGVDKTAAELAVARLTGELRALETELRNAETRSDDDWIPPDFWEESFRKAIIPAIIIAMISLALQKFAFSGIVALFFIICLIAHIVFGNDRKDRASRLKKNEMERITTDLNIKREQYRKNRSIAES